MDYFKPTDHTDPWMNHIFDLSAYIGQSISIEFQSCARYGDNYYTTGGVQHGDQSFVDNINIFNSIWGCTDTLASNYNALANANDGSCVYPCHVANTYANGFEDGLASLNLTPADWTQNTDDNTTGNSNYVIGFGMLLGQHLLLQGLIILLTMVVLITLWKVLTTCILKLQVITIMMYQ
jgi:hypothetical protein